MNKLNKYVHSHAEKNGYPREAWLLHMELPIILSVAYRQTDISVSALYISEVRQVTLDNEIWNVVIRSLFTISK